MKVGRRESHAVLMAPSNSPAVPNCIPTSCLLIQAQQCSTGFKSGELGGQLGSKTNPRVRKNLVVLREVWHDAPSCM